MIFVTVGTHEQPFNRLIEAIDTMVGDGTIREEVIMQTGYSTYTPVHCTWSKLIPYQKMQEYIRQARIVITHGGPASFIAPLQIGKVPVVVPRQTAFNEHVNDHQVEFTKAVSERMGTIIPVYDIRDLTQTITDYDTICNRIGGTMGSNNPAFMAGFNKMIEELF